MSKFLILINILILIVYSNRILKEEDPNSSVFEINLGDFSEYYNVVGKKGTLVIEESYPYQSELNIIDIEKKTSFKTTISDKYEVNCGLWRQEDRRFLVFCNVDESLPAGEYNLKLNGTSFEYKNYEICLIAKDLTFKKLDANVIDLYADKQSINIEEGKENYDLKFKIVSYNKEKIIFNYENVVDNCRQEKDELICPISKSRLEEIMSPQNFLKYQNLIFVSFLNTKNKIKTFDLIPFIEVKTNIPKKDVFVGITKLLEKVGEHDTVITYETNVTDITKVKSSLGDSLELEFENKEGVKKCECSFRKYENTPLLIVCWVNGQYWLKKIEEEIIIEDSNIKYNFRIQPVEYTEKIIFDSDERGSFISWVYPEILDFTKKDSFIVEYFLEEAKSIKGVTFNEKAKDLDCEDFDKNVKRCTVTKDHFKGQKSDFYFTKHSNHIGGKSISYEAPPIKVILKSKGNYISYYFGFLLFLIILF